MKITDLPLELLVEILTYLPEERLKCALSNKRFYEASLHPRFKRDLRLQLRAAHLDENSDPVRLFEGSRRVFSEVVFHDTSFGTGYKKFLRGILQCTQEVTIKYFCRTIETQHYAAIIGECGHLKTLSINLYQGCREVLNTSLEEKAKIKQGVRTVEKLIMSVKLDTRFKEFVEFLEWMPQLKTIDLRGLRVRAGKEKQFYDLFLLPYIERHSTTLKGILFKQDFEPEYLEKYEKLMQMNDLRLNSMAEISMGNCSAAEYDFFRKFLMTKCQLNELHLNHSFLDTLQWSHLIEIIKEQKHLKRLDVDHFPFFLAVEAGLLHLLPEIESVVVKDSVDGYRYIVPLVNEANLVPAVNHTLKELIIPLYSCFYTSTWLNCEFKALRRLELRNCDETLTDEDVHLICEKLPQLTDFLIAHHYTITDFAITGRPLGKSKAPTPKTKTAIVDLKKLKTLAFYSLKKVTHHALSDLKLTNLHSLSLENCKGVNHEAIEYIVENCPNIETLNINYCNKLKDASVEIICQGLPKLRRLKINKLPHVTTNVFDIIGQSAPNLQYLHMKSYTKFGNRQELAQGLFHQLPMLKMVKLGSGQEVHRTDTVE